MTKVANSTHADLENIGQSECQRNGPRKYSLMNEMQERALAERDRDCKDLHLESSFQQPVSNWESLTNCRR